VRDALLGQLPWQRWRQVLAAWPREAGVLPARFEIVYGHAWKLAAPDPAMGQDAGPDAPAVIRFHPHRPSYPAGGQ
jgi:malonyl-CoA O-methyltransferase